MSELILRRAIHHAARLLRRTRKRLLVMSQVGSASPRPASQAPKQHTSHDVSASAGSVEARSLMDMPGPKGWPLIGSFAQYFKKENMGQMHEMMRKRHQAHGPIFREQFGPRYNVAVADPDLMEEIFRCEGKYPKRPPYESWVLYNKLRHRSGGLMSSADEYWRRSRSSLSPRLRPRAVNEYVDGMNLVASDMLRHMSELKDRPGSGNMVPGILNELNRFTMESLWYVLLNKRIGCLDENVPKDVDRFIESVTTMFQTGQFLMVYCWVHQMLGTGPWKRHVAAWDYIFDFGGKHINEKIDESMQELKDTSPTEEYQTTDFIKYVYATHMLSRDEIIDNTLEVFIGGIDTTANAIAFMFYMLATHQEEQARLTKEVDHVVGKRQPTANDLQNMPFLKACVKETLRLFPPVPMNARETTKDIVIGGYLIPRDTIIMMNIYTMGRDENVFSSPDEFVPDRWLRASAKDSDSNVPSPFTLIPFGLGARSCIGRRIAEYVIYLLSIQVLQNYSLKKSDEFDIKIMTRTQLSPGPDLPVMFVDR